jgi:hypothetical protein
LIAALVPRRLDFSHRDLDRKIPDQIREKGQEDKPSQRSVNQDDNWLQGLVALNPGDDTEADGDVVRTDFDTRLGMDLKLHH